MNTFRTYSFEKLEAWKLAREIKLDIYLLTKEFPKEEIYGLTSQYRRSADSIATNLAEGSGRAHHTDKAHFTNIAYSSALEVINHTISAFDLLYISFEEYNGVRTKLDKVMLMLDGLYKYQLKSEVSLKSKYLDSR